MDRKSMENILEELQDAGLELAQDELPKTRLEKFLVLCRSGHIRTTHMKDIRRGRYCGECRYDKIRNDHWGVYDRLQELDITLLEPYKNSRSKSKLQCQSCDYIWEARIDSALSGSRGCPSCANRGFNPKKSGYLYYLKVTTDDKTFYKIGITNKESLNDRFCNQDMDKITILRKLYFDLGSKAYELEQYYLKLFAQYRYHGDQILKSGGNTEIFTTDILSLDTKL